MDNRLAKRTGAARDQDDFLIEVFHLVQCSDEFVLCTSVYCSRSNAIAKGQIDRLDRYGPQPVLNCGE